MLIGNFAGSMAEEGTENYVAELFGELSSSPFGGSATLSAGEFEGEQGTISMEWGLGLGSYLLLLSGIIMFVSGILEFAGRKVFFEPKVPYGRHKALKHKPPVVATTPPEEKPVEKPKEKQKEEPKKEPKQEEAKNESEKVYCPHCGRELKKGATFCADCGGKI